MPMTVDQIVLEVRRLPREQAAELFDRLLVETVATPDPEIEAAWKREIRRRIDEIESGREPGVAGEEVMAELRQIVGR
jgi:putative addiction module component (TIGR02574 family)